MKGWADLPTDLFSLIPFWDGRMVARARAVCKTWQESIERYEYLMDMFLLHYIRIDDIKMLDKEISRHPNQLSILSQSTATEITESILFLQHKFNGYMIKDVFCRYSLHPTGLSAKTYDLITPDKFAATFGWGGENLEYFLDGFTGDIILVNNFAARFSKWEDPSEVEGMQFLQDTFKGDITWKLIDFPVQIGGHYMIAKKDFCQGGCYLVRFKNRTGRLKKHRIGKSLREEAKKKRNRRELNHIERVVHDYAKKE